MIRNPLDLYQPLNLISNSLITGLSDEYQSNIIYAREHEECKTKVERDIVMLILK